MKAKISHIQAGISKWYIKEIASLDWKLTFAAPLFKIYVNNVIAKNMKTLNLVMDENGEIDIDELHKEYSAIINTRGSIDIYGVKITAKDLDSLMEFIKAEIPAKI